MLVRVPLATLCSRIDCSNVSMAVSSSSKNDTCSRCSTKSCWIGTAAMAQSLAVLISRVSLFLPSRRRNFSAVPGWSSSMPLTVVRTTSSSWSRLFRAALRACERGIPPRREGSSPTPHQPRGPRVRPRIFLIREILPPSVKSVSADFDEPMSEIQEYNDIGPSGGQPIQKRWVGAVPNQGWRELGIDQEFHATTTP